ncbi:hypothetical protein [Engelhardtia mirabilis]|uniref:Uncharacterized protein n=1 Tax=Engelhardtia mirabilis TaxID=2528011 RepID=A0A518BNN6_9BACT|nr:hypothetical protein Pla133_36510 [Planctomycetes bacterium Pla133]QDV02878.1 hypothetical protein Pla86_36490 [Planctomycetes bacterium Pla86]
MIQPVDRPSRFARALFADEPAPRLWRVGWWVVWAVLFCAVFALLADLPPGSYMPLAGFATFVAALVAPIWLVGTYLGIRTALARRRWVDVAPLMPWAMAALLATGVIGTVLGDFPERAAFALSRPALDDLVAEVTAVEPELQEFPPRLVGLYLADEITHFRSGRVRFTVLGTRDFWGQYGLLWIPEGGAIPAGNDYEFEDWGHGWFAWRRDY